MRRPGGVRPPWKTDLMFRTDVAAAVETAASSGMNWGVAVVSFLGAVVGAAAAGVFKARTEARARKATAQTQALYDLQTAADKYRRVLIDIGDVPRETLKQRKAYDKAESNLAIAVDRIECDAVRDHAEAWQTTALYAWRDVEGYTPEMERGAWENLRGDIRTELRRYDA